MTLKFTYTNKKGEKKERNLLVIHESETKIGGFDLKYLDRKEQYQVRKLFSEKKVTPFSETRSKKGEGHCTEAYWRAYRVFDKSSIK